MKWYKKLYMGEQASREKYKIFGRVAAGRLQPDVWLITLPTNPDNVLDLLPVLTLKNGYYRKYGKKSLSVVGMGKGREEALEVTRQIVDEVYQHTGGFDVAAYLHFGAAVQKQKDDRNRGKMESGV